MPRKPIRPRSYGKRRKPRLGLRISKGLDKLLEFETSQPKATSESIFSMSEHSILKRIQDILLEKRGGSLTEVDYSNLKSIARKHNIKL